MRALKDELRREMRIRRLDVSMEQSRKCAEMAARHIARIPGFREAGVVAVYAPVRGELDTAPLVSELRSRGKTVCYPCMAPSHRLLAFHAVDDETRLVPSRLGIPEPTEDMPVVPSDRIEWIIVPGLAFDARGGRLGWGRAYYDTTLAAKPLALRVGLAHGFQIVHSVPETADDERMDAIVTELGARLTLARTQLNMRRKR
ncbi:MAG: 5-formyltetrahydrofolate cyclo-ligase [Deltaproteobacteria bacterium]|nr:5-formyltetrahydrofolate cyclo-ligase [Deltaproteobacteria bacterium]